MYPWWPKTHRGLPASVYLLYFMCMNWEDGGRRECPCCGTHVEVRRQLGRVGSFLPPCAPKDWIQVIRFGRKHIYHRAIPPSPFYTFKVLGGLWESFTTGLRLASHPNRFESLKMTVIWVLILERCSIPSYHLKFLINISISHQGS